MKRINVLIILVLVILNIILSIILTNHKNQQYPNDNSGAIINDLRNTILLNILNADLSINPLQILQIENDSAPIPLKEFAQVPKLFLFYNAMSCSPCTDLELHKFDSLSKKLGSDNVFLLTKKMFFKNIYLLRKTNNYSFKVAFIEDLQNLQAISIPINFYFILDMDFVLKLFFVPLKNDEKMTDKYYARVEDFFQTTNNK